MDSEPLGTHTKWQLSISEEKFRSDTQQVGVACRTVQSPSGEPQAAPARQANISFPNHSSCDSPNPGESCLLEADTQLGIPSLLPVSLSEVGAMHLSLLCSQDPWWILWLGCAGRYVGLVGICSPWFCTSLFAWTEQSCRVPFCHMHREAKGVEGPGVPEGRWGGAAASSGGPTLHFQTYGAQLSWSPLGPENYGHILHFLCLDSMPTFPRNLPR